jgi:hypothetical protein
MSDINAKMENKNKPPVVNFSTEKYLQNKKYLDSMLKLGRTLFKSNEIIHCNVSTEEYHYDLGLMEANKFFKMLPDMIQHVYN